MTNKVNHSLEARAVLLVNCLELEISVMAV